MLKNNPQLKAGWSPELIQITNQAPSEESLSVLLNNLTRRINKALEQIQIRMELMRSVPNVFKAYLTEVSGDYTVTPLDYAIVISSGNFTTITMPSSAQVQNQVFPIKNNSSGVVNVIGSDLFERTETILQLETGDAAMLYSTGERWVIL